MLKKRELLYQTATAFRAAMPAAPLHSAGIDQLAQQLHQGEVAAPFKRLERAQGIMRDFTRPWERYSTSEAAIFRRWARKAIDIAEAAKLSGYLSGYTEALRGGEYAPKLRQISPDTSDAFEKETAHLSEEAKHRIVYRLQNFLECTPAKRMMILDADTPEKQEWFLEHIAKNRREIRRERRKLIEEDQRLQAEIWTIEAQKEHLKILVSLKEFIGTPTPLEAAKESWFYKLGDAYADGIIMRACGNDDVYAISDRGLEVINTKPELFVVQHNWAAAFDRAADIASGEWRLPAEESLFEFQFTGYRVCVFCRAEEGAPQWLHVFVRCRDNIWVDTGTIDREEMAKDGNDALSKILLANIRAICIALDAEVVEREVVRAPHLTNSRRETSGRKALDDYHIISLTRRQRAIPQDLPSSGDGQKRKVRLHFRRGHWRHFEKSKTWIKWMLVGNPDLGFIAKEYRL